MFIRKMFVFASIMVALTFLFCVCSYGEGSIGLTYSQIIDDISYGLIVNHKQDFELGELETNSQIQAGDKYLADAHLSFTFDFWHIGLRPYVDAIGKSETLANVNDLGGKLDYGLTFNLPLHETTEAGVGVFLRNANPFAPKVLYELKNDEYIPVDTNAGINYDNPAMLNLLAYTGFEINRFDVELKGSIGLGERDYWLIANIDTGFDLEYFELDVGVNIGNRWYVNTIGKNTNRADIAIISNISRKW